MKKYSFKLCHFFLVFNLSLTNLKTLYFFSNINFFILSPNKSDPALIGNSFHLSIPPSCDKSNSCGRCSLYL